MRFLCLPSLCHFSRQSPKLKEWFHLVLSASWQCLIVLPVSKLQPTMWLLYLASLNSMPQFKSLSDQKSGWVIGQAYTQTFFSVSFFLYPTIHTKRNLPHPNRIHWSRDTCSVYRRQRTPPMSKEVEKSDIYSLLFSCEPVYRRQLTPPMSKEDEKIWHL